MSIFAKKPNSQKIAFFCNWFIDNNELFIEPMKQKEQNITSVIESANEIQGCLAVPYRDGYKGNIELEYGFNQQENKWELDLFHLNDTFLIKTTSMIKEYLDSRIGETWIIRVTK
ncbi:MAG: hypothetical protein KKH01_02140 [Firmicutes bacterium]|nr:hypothetical protein [Bacillota bacterium]